VSLYIYEENVMAIETTYTQARQGLKALLDEVTENREQVIIRRRGGDDVAMIAADELRGLIETAHLLRSPENARRLLRALERATSQKGRPQTLEKLRADLGLDRED
jgi:antitoxin YefM